MKRLLVVLFLICFLFATPCIAASRVFINPDVTITWTDAVTGGDELLDLGGSNVGSSTMGSYLDTGAILTRTADGTKISKSIDYTFEMTIDGFDSAPVVGESIDLYFSQSNATTGFDGVPSSDPTDTAEGTITEHSAILKNLIFAGSALVVDTSVTRNLKISGIVRLPLRYISPIVHNNTADELESSGDTHTVKLTPIPLEATP